MATGGRSERIPGVTSVTMMIATNQRRGAEVFGVTLAEHLSERGFDVSLLALNPSPTEPRLDLEPAGRSRLDPRMWWAAYRSARDR